MKGLATLVLTIHLAWILWVVLGALWTRGRTVLATFHVLSLGWGIIVELSPLPCPLTLAEQFFEDRAGGAYEGGFLLHWLDRLVYPAIPDAVLTGIGVAVCVLNIAVYVRRYWKAGRRAA
ncbi:MAG TPA: DUF2784 domain-containing protein [Bryobacteraceae bacterium]